MIVENLIEVKAHAPRWPNEQELLKTLRKVIKAMPGKVAVLCDPHLKETKGGILYPDGKYQGSQNSDTGTVVSSGYRYLDDGDRVAFLPMEGLRYDWKEASWIPEGCEVRFYMTPNAQLVRVEE